MQGFESSANTSIFKYNIEFLVFIMLNNEITHQLHNFCSICEADMLKKPDQRYLTAHQPGQPAFLQNALTPPLIPPY
jgi:hypothetical protein